MVQKRYSIQQAAGNTRSAARIARIMNTEDRIPRGYREDTERIRKSCEYNTKRAER